MYRVINGWLFAASFVMTWWHEDNDNDKHKHKKNIKNINIKSDY